MDDQVSGYHSHYRKGHENLYAELNRQKDLKQTYRKSYKDLQGVVTTTESNIMLQQPIVVTSNKVKANLKF